MWLWIFPLGAASGLLPSYSPTHLGVVYLNPYLWFREKQVEAFQKKLSYKMAGKAQTGIVELWSQRWPLGLVSSDSFLVSRLNPPSACPLGEGPGLEQRTINWLLGHSPKDSGKQLCDTRKGSWAFSAGKGCLGSSALHMPVLDHLLI